MTDAHKVARLREVLYLLLDPGYYSMTYPEVVRWLDDLRVRARNVLAETRSADHVPAEPRSRQ